MALVTSTFTFTSDTETVTRTKLNNLVADLLTEFNGSIESVNIKSGGVAASNMGTGSVSLTSSAITGILPSSNAAATPGTVAASEIVTVDANKDVTGLRDLTITGAASVGTALTVGTTLTVNATTISETEIGFLDGVTAGTSAASKAVVLDGSSKIDALDITALTLNGTAVTSTAAEINKLDAADVVVQVVNSSDSSVATGTTTVPFDDTIPQNTEGDQYLSVSITPKNASNKLIIDVKMHLTNTGGEAHMTLGLFQDSGANAIAAFSAYRRYLNISEAYSLTHYMTAGTTSPITFKVRAGSSTGGTTTFNGVSGSRRLGGVMSSYITVTEIDEA